MTFRFTRHMLMKFISAVIHGSYSSHSEGVDFRDGADDRSRLRLAWLKDEKSGNSCPISALMTRSGY